MNRSPSLREHDTNDFPVVWREEMEGLTAEIRADRDTNGANPRDYDNLGEMLCWHPDYYLGDKQFKDGDGRGATRTPYEHSDFGSIGDLAAKLVAEGAVCVLPLYLFDHSGISISAGGNYVGRGDTASGGHDDFGNARGWDTTLCGVIYTTRERVKELCGEEKGEALYCPPDWQGTPADWVASQLKNEVELYDRYLKGEVYYYIVKDGEGEDLDSCYGYLPDVSVPYAEELDYLRGEAHDALVAAVEEQREKAARERDEAARAANMDVATRAS